jgi:peptidoglycan/xylan/chitin deacetylase (PgdA/CDA1 family)
MADGRQLHLLFHGIGVPGRALEPGEDEFWVGVDQFRRILDEAMSWPGVVFSFDDGNLSDVEIGLPELQQRGLQARFNVIAGRLGEPGSLGEGEVRALVDAGMPLGSHGMVHRSWRGLDGPTAHDELVAAREILEGLSGDRVTVAACPFGDYDRTALQHLRRAGYGTVLTSDRRPARSGHWLQPRFSVRSHDTPAALRAELLSPSVPVRARRVVAGVVKRVR